jgi:hypothetical protein
MVEPCSSSTVFRSPKFIGLIPVVPAIIMTDKIFKKQGEKKHTGSLVFSSQNVDLK